MTKGIAQTRKVRDSLRGTMRGELVKIKYTRTLGAHAWDERELGIIREETERWSRGISAISPPTPSSLSSTDLESMNRR